MAKMKEKKEKKSDEQFRQELQLLYSLCVSDIAFAKSEQWKITNYTVAIYGTLFAIWKTVIVPSSESDRFGIEFFAIILLGLLVLFFSIKMILIDQNSLKRSRQRIRKIVDEFSDEFKEVFNQTKLKEHKRKNLTVFIIQVSIVTLSYLTLIYALIKIKV